MARKKKVDPLSADQPLAVDVNLRRLSEKSIDVDIQNGTATKAEGLHAADRDHGIGSSASSPSRCGTKYELPEGLTKSQKKNLRKKLRDKEKKAEEAAGIRRGVPQLPDDPLQFERTRAVQSILKALGELPSLAEMKSIDVLEKYREQQDTLQDLMTTADDAQESYCIKIKRPDNRRMSSSHLLDRIRELAALPESDDVALKYLEDQLLVTVSWENARKFLPQIAEVRQKVEERQRTNQRSYDGAKAWERKIKLVDRVKSTKQLISGGSEDDELVTTSNLVTTEIEISPDAQIVMLPPLSIYRRMERVFGIAVDRSPNQNKQRTFLLSGLENDVNEAVKFIQDTDWSGNFKVSVDSKIMPQLIGKGGTGIRQLEEKYKCFFQTKENNDVVIYGSHANATEASQHIAQLKSDRVPDQTNVIIPLGNPAIARSLQTTFIRKIRDIEEKNGVTVRVSPGPSSGANGVPEAVFGADVSFPTNGRQSEQKTASRPPTSVFTGPLMNVRGSTKLAVEAAKSSLVQIIDHIKAVDIAGGTEEAMRRLFSRVSSNGEVDITRGARSPSSRGQPSVGDRFCDLVGVTTDVAFIRQGDALVLVGYPEAIKKVYDQAKSLVQIAGYTATKVSIDTQQMPAFTNARIAEISEQTGASLTMRRPRGPEGMWIEILGSEVQKAEAKEKISEVLQNEAVVVKLKIMDDETLNQLLRDRASRMRSLEDTFATRISADRANKCCTIIGGPNGTKASREAIEEMDAKNMNLKSKSIPIPAADMIRRIIGIKGATISQIKNMSKVDSIDVDDAELVVNLRGTLESTAAAEKLLNEIFSLAQKQQNTLTRSNNPVPTPRSSKLQSVVADWGDSVVSDGLDKPMQSPPADLRKGWNSGERITTSVSITDGEVSFPTLGEAAQHGKSPKRRYRRRRNGAAGDCVSHSLNCDLAEQKLESNDIIVQES